MEALLFFWFFYLARSKGSIISFALQECFGFILFDLFGFLSIMLLLLL